ncbi:hypothetical protein E1301_Tti021884 [Triplophysa tibetana]|uniref:Uncharacterized protein n=1 Tax=Triplophysa tibetana TaxID=1572043 RepID=A0A5A9PG66_9TELE|nr:hypothetical protein E1301_Tti021884 [Triplophysa tibetana]
MSSAAKQDTVWMGFMDIVPVIGTVKEAVELVLALYEGDKGVILKKEKAFENIVKESLKKFEKLTPAAAAAAAAGVYNEHSGLRNVREVSKEKIIEYMMIGSKKGPKPQTAAEQKVRQKKVQVIQRDMLEKIQILKPDFYEELKEELKRSNRGEHVFNNDILKFHLKVLTEFKREQDIDDRPGYLQVKEEVDALGKHTLSQNTAAEIQTNMVVHFGADEFYVNANTILYGEYCRALRDALLVVLRNINPDDVTGEQRERVNSVIDNMNNLEIFVDQLAKVSWIANKRDRQERFDRVKQDLVRMYKTARGLQWCLEILRLFQRFYNQGQ